MLVSGIKCFIIPLKWEKVGKHVLREKNVSMVMLIGEYTHLIDEKKRVSLPAKFRKELGRKVVVTHGLDNCLFLYSLKSWMKVSEKLGQLSIGKAQTRGFNRFMLAGAVEAEVDSIGRILIPDFLKKIADLDSRVV